MNQQKAKLLRKVAKITGQSTKYVKSGFKQMTPDQQVSYIDFVKEKLSKKL